MRAHLHPINYKKLEFIFKKVVETFDKIYFIFPEST